MGASSEIGRELKVSELEVGTVVVVSKAGRPFQITMWVRRLTDTAVFLYAGEVGLRLVLVRCGDARDQVEDEDHLPMKFNEYLGVL